MGRHGRRESPDEHDIGDVIGQRAVLNRTIRAQIGSVDADNGFVTINYESMPAGGKHTTIKPLWISFPDAKVGNPAWGRFIPQTGDLVRVAFDYDDRPVIVGYDIAAEKAGAGDGLSGWPALQDQYKNAKNSSAPGSKAKFLSFVPLKPGEYDFMSSGGAYIYGNNRGCLYMAGGSVSVSLIKNDLRIEQRAQLLSHTADHCELRFGQVRRTDAASQLDKKVSIDSAGAFKEFSVVLNKTTDANTHENLAMFKIGNVVNNSGSVIGLGVNNPYRYLYRTYKNGEESFQMSIDNQGNWDVLAAEHATNGVTFDFTEGNWDTKFKTVTHTNSEKTSIDSPDINLGAVDAPEALILGNTYTNAEKDYVRDLSDQIKDLATALQTLSTAVGIFATAAGVAGATSTSPATAVTAAQGIGSAATTLAPTAIQQTAKAAAVVAQVPIISNLFAEGYSKYLSEVVKTK